MISARGDFVGLVCAARRPWSLKDDGPLKLRKRNSTADQWNSKELQKLVATENREFSHGLPESQTALTPTASSDVRIWTDPS